MLVGVAIATLVTSYTAVATTAATAADDDTMIYVAPAAGDSGAGTAADPVSLAGARDIVRTINSSMSSDIVVVLEDGTYRLNETLALTAEDSGSNGYAVRWTAADGATPVISGSDAITDWTEYDETAEIYSAPVDPDAESRNLYVNDASAIRAQTKFTRPSTGSFVDDGLAMTDAMAFLRDLTPAELAATELRGINSFTDRYSGVEGLNDDGTTLLMEQPGWKNNTWGWDTLATPFHESGFYAENALTFLNSDNEWFLDTEADILYYKPASGVDMTTASVELPRLETLLTIAGSVENQAHDIDISGLTFSGTTWNDPTETGGYADQQTGGYLSVGDDYPSEGYIDFEASRPFWKQIPSAVQIAAATDVAISDSRFIGLGASGLGIGNDATANDSGVGLATQRISVTGSSFTATGSNAITIGGIEQQAHHPGTLADGTRDPNVSDDTVARMTVSEIEVSNNRIWNASDTYTSGVGILMTYAQESVIAHNDVTDMPYGGINTGYGWGANDAGGSSEYESRGLYDHQPLFSTPTTAKNNTISANYVARFGQRHTDLGAFYNLSANFGTVYDGNYIVEERNRAFYPDEGSRGMEFNNNVAINGDWWGANFRAPNTSELHGTGNWISEGNTIMRANRDTLVEATTFEPADVVGCEITAIRYNAGIAPDMRTADDTDRPSSACLDVSPETSNGDTVITATFEDIANDVTGFSLAAEVDAGWVATPTGDAAPATLTAGTPVSASWAISASGALESAIETTNVTLAAHWDGGTGEARIGVSVGGEIQSPFRDTGNGAYLAGQLGDDYALWEAGADMWGVNQHDDDYASIYAADSFGDGSTVSATVTAQERVDDWTKSGLVVRNDLATPFSPGGYVILVVTPGKGVIMSADRDNDGLLDKNVIAGGVTAPVTLKMTRTDDVVEGSYSTDDGETWTSVGFETLFGADNMLDTGLVHVSHGATTFSRADFTNFSITPEPAPATLASIEVSAAPAEATAGQSVQLTVTGTDSRGASVDVDSDDVVVTSDIASDAVAGTSVGVKDAGIHTFTVRAGELTATTQVEVSSAELTELSLGLLSETVRAGNAVSFIVTGKDSFGNAIAVPAGSATLSSDVESDAVSGTMITMTEAGKRTITATWGGITTTAEVTVTAAAAAELQISVPSASVDQGGSVTLSVTGQDEFGNAATIDPDDVTVTSNVDTDEVDGLTVRFPHASPHTLTITVGAVSTTLLIEVIPAADSADDTAAEASTGPLAYTGQGGTGLLALIAGLLLLIGTGAIVAKRVRTQRN
ncbi:hypothetical protein [Salinibacterium sp. NK8237]|uniref:hypothetical protein n=1 Tax=Salinibacterium sp. NK8237 TaxID=2792038 RepID=UPI0018CE2077|nr:hypothetical protein [Salinibacterium sp. NK8237]MBH0129953.1 hypothetical protein [Salinibacterium sp. NK8237]